MTENPLLVREGLPAFSAIEVGHVEPGLRALLAELREELRALEADVKSSWEGVVVPLEALGDRLAVAWGTVGHLMGVRNGDELRAAFENVQPEVVRFSLEQAQSRPIHRALEALRAGDAWESLDAAQQRIVEGLLREARHSGVGLEGVKRERFNAVQEELAGLATAFNNRVLDATRAWSLTLRDPAQMEGTPDSLRELCAQTAREAGETEATAESGPWQLGLDAPCVVPFLEHARRRDLREKVYRAHQSKAGEGDLDNAPLIERMLELRSEEAELLGYASYADLSLASRVASFEAAEEDLENLRALAARSGAAEGEDFCHWDTRYWAERLREERYAYSEEELRSYFPLTRVLEGLFALTRRLFGVSIEAADGEADVWHPDVRFFRVRDETGEEIAAFFLDPYSRPSEKRGGAWMDECVGRSRRLAAPGEGLRRPVAYLVCNQAPPVEGRPSLMSFSEVTTPAAYADASGRGHGGGHSQHRVGRGGVAESVHGELVLPAGDPG